jgi:hypothetical protein
MRFQPLSDIHLEFYKDSSTVKIKDTDSDCIILAGDIHTKTRAIKWLLDQKINKPIFYICGNHEFYGTNWPRNIDKLKEAAKDTNIHVLENDYYIFKDWIILGCTLWTDYKLLEPIVPQQLAMSACFKGMNDFYKIRNSNFGYKKIIPSDLLHAHYESVDFLKTYLEVFNGCNIAVLTHHTPSIKCIDPTYHKDILSAAYASNLDEFVAYSGAKIWFTGHTHYKYKKFMLGDTLLVSNPMGYLNYINEDFDPKQVEEV